MTYWWEFWSRNMDIFIILLTVSIKNENWLNSNNNRSKLKFLRLLWDIFVFRLVVYLLSMIRFIYIDFRINLAQFNINFLRQEHYIELSWVSIWFGTTLNTLKYCFDVVPLSSNLLSLQCQQLLLKIASKFLKL